MSKIEIEIDGKKLTAEPNQMIIQVADEAGVYIPRFCYHKHLSIAANCRMCLVEVEKSPKTLPACATPVMPGMKVFTKSSKALAAQRAVMEFLLINHPLDCPVCDQGGECELQDLAMGYGNSASHYHESKRAVHDEDLGPLIATEMTRCILCTRCVRFGDEIAGLRELGVLQRGEEAEISTYVKHAIQSPVSGNIIDICPVGALTSKPFRFKARTWELEQKESIAPHDCLGTNINVHTYNGAVLRVVARENNHINETWLADRDRFSYEGLYHADRITSPRIRTHGEWHDVSWEKALEVAAQGLQAVVSEHGSDALGTLASPNATVEEFYLLQKITRALGSPHIDHRLRECDTRDQAEMPLFPGWEYSLPELEAADTIFLIGSHLFHEQPLAALRVRKAVQHHQATVLALNAVDYRFNFDVIVKIIVSPHEIANQLEVLLNALEKGADHPFAHHLRDKKAVCIVLGALAQHHQDAALIRHLSLRLARATKGRVNIMTAGANTAGGWIAGAIPHRGVGGESLAQIGLSAHAMLREPRQGYILLNVEPELDCANPFEAAQALKEAKYVVALSMYANPTLNAHADVILPIAPFTETSGTFVNAEGSWQSFKGVAKAFAASRPAWKVLRVLGNFLHLAGFDYESSEEVREEVRHASPVTKRAEHAFPVIARSARSGMTAGALSRIGDIPLYSLDSLVRRSMPLQVTQTIMEGNMDALRLHSATAERLGLTSGDRVKVVQGRAHVQLSVSVDDRIAKEAVWIPAGVAATAELGDLFGEVMIQKL